MKKLLKLLGFVLTLLFLWAAYVQFNDPDAEWWIALYLLAALGTLLFSLNRLPYWVGIIMAVVYGILAIVYWPETFEGVQIGGGDISNIERGRESLGMGITAVVFLLLGFAAKK